MHLSPVRGLTAVALTICLSLGAASTAAASGKHHGGRGVPDQQISVQLWTFSQYIGFGTDAATIARTEEVFGKLRSYGYRNVEPFTLSGMTAEQYRALLDKYHLKASARHVDVGTPGKSGEHRPDHRGQQDARDQVLRLRRHPDLPADLHHRGGVGRVRQVPQRGRREGAPGRSAADGAQPRHRVLDEVRQPDGVRHPDGEHRPAERRLPARPLLGDVRRRGPGRGAQALREANPAVPRQGHAWE